MLFIQHPINTTKTINKNKRQNDTFLSLSPQVSLWLSKGIPVPSALLALPGPAPILLLPLRLQDQKTAGSKRAQIPSTYSSQNEEKEERKNFGLRVCV